jgi:hypothetical protein
MKKSELKQVIREEMDTLTLEKILNEVELVDPFHIKMTENGGGEFPDTYKLTSNGVKAFLDIFKWVM